MSMRERVRDAIGAALIFAVVLGLVWMSYRAFVAPRGGCSYGPFCW